MNVEKYVMSNKIAVLVSSGFGAGWSTWNQRELAYDKRVVEFWLEHKNDKAFIACLEDLEENKTKEKVLKLFKSWGYSGVYFGGFSDIALEWVPIGTWFKVSEYDGSESITYLANDSYIQA